MNASLPPDDSFLDDAAGGSEPALAVVFDHYRVRLKRMVWLRLDRRLQGRIDPSDVVQEAYLDLARELPAYAEKRAIPLFLWMRLVTGQRLMRLHRKHLGAEMRDVTREISIQKGVPQANSESMAVELMGNDTSASKAVIRSEVQQQLQDALNQMDSIDREIIALRNFEQLDNSEAAEVLGLSSSAASKRYVRALKRLQDILTSVPGLIDDEA